MMNMITTTMILHTILRVMFPPLKRGTTWRYRSCTVTECTIAERTVAERTIAEHTIAEGTIAEGTTAGWFMHRHGR